MLWDPLVQHEPERISEVTHCPQWATRAKVSIRQIQAEGLDAKTSIGETKTMAATKREMNERDIGVVLWVCY